MKNKRGDKIISVYWFAILFIVTAAVVYMASLFYGAPYDVREIEANILAEHIANCLAEGGYLRQGILNNENFKENFLEECNLIFNVEDVYGWKEQEQYYLSVSFYEFDQNLPSGIGDLLPFNISKGNVNLKIASSLEDLKEKRNIDTIVIHYTAGPSLESAQYEFESTTKSIHYIIDKDGTVSTGVDENTIAGHSGCGVRPRCHSNDELPDAEKYPDTDKNCCRRGINDRSIGIELVNLGNMCGDETNKRLCDFGNRETCKMICEDAGKGIEIKGIVWESYTDEQIESLSTLVSGIVSRHEIPIDREHIIGHNEVDPGRKLDPGPAFYWDEFIEKVNSKSSLITGIVSSGFDTRSFYVLNKADNKKYIIQVSAFVGKKEKNEA